jgi:hypothetical protein
MVAGCRFIIPRYGSHRADRTLKCDCCDAGIRSSDNVNTLYSRVHLWKFDDDADRRAHWVAVYANKDFVEGHNLVDPSGIRLEVPTSFLSCLPASAIVRLSMSHLDKVNYPATA